MISIYALVDPDTNSVRYIGKSNNPTRRLFEHYKEEGNTRKHNWITHLRHRGKLPQLKILQITTDATWQTDEAYWIKYYCDLGSDLCNLTSGGEGIHNPSIVTRSKISRNGKRLWQLNKDTRLAVLKSKEHRDKISKSLKGRPKSLAWRKKMQEIALKRWQNPEERRMHSSRMQQWHKSRSVNRIGKGDER